ncbi:hypothetical protein PGTUg99_016955 [Puccinia graminis f. sp. tritici]|uniref:F-box domain-containing protein n=1 Tax=Puccinia graminis f. sp. tritici TaxID=56615 RepID=A0A5B0PBU1_PUCGR|nr:hypothetical protein PGTUg99_016955 [Puccinia graminis f. sp. tritici]
MPSIHVLIYVLTFWLSPTLDHLGSPLSHGASAAATPSIKRLVQVENPDRIASGAESKNKHFPEGKLFQTGAEEGENFGIGSSHIADRPLEPTDDKSIQENSQEFKGTASFEPPKSIRSKTDATNIAPFPSDSPQHASSIHHVETRTHPGSLSARHGKESISNLEPDYARTPSDSSGYGYDWHSQTNRLGRIEDTDKYGTNSEHEVVNLQPFEWRLQPFNYYQLTAVYQPVTQWGYVPVPIDPNRTSAPNHPYQTTTGFHPANPYRATNYVGNFAERGDSNSVPYELSRKEGPFKPPNSSHLANRASLEKSHRQWKPVDKGQAGSSSSKSPKKIYNPVKTTSEADKTHAEVSEMGAGNPHDLFGESAYSHLSLSTHQSKELVKLMSGSKDESIMISQNQLPISPPEESKPSFSRNTIMDPESSSEVGRSGPTPSSSGISTSWTDASSEAESPAEIDSASQTGTSNEVRNHSVGSPITIQGQKKAKSLDFHTLDQIYFKETSPDTSCEVKNHGKQKKIQPERQRSRSSSGDTTEDELEAHPDQNKQIEDHNTHDNRKADSIAEGNNKVPSSSHQDESAKEVRKHKAKRKKKNNKPDKDFDNETEHEAVKGSKPVSTSPNNNKFELISPHMHNEIEKSNVNAEETIAQVRPLIEIIQESTGARKRKSLSSQLVTSLTNAKQDLPAAGVETESATETFTKDHTKPLRLWEKYHYTRMNVFNIDTRMILNLPVELLKLIFSEAKTKVLRFLSKTQAGLSRNHLLEEDSQEMKLRGIKLDIPVLDHSAKKQPKNDKPLNKTSKKTSTPVLQDSQIQSTKKVTHLDEDQTRGKDNQEVVLLDDSYPAFFKSNTKNFHMLDEHLETPGKAKSKKKEQKANPGRGDEGQAICSIPGYEKKYLTVEPNLSPVNLANFQLLGETLHAENKNFDFSIGLNFEGLTKTKRRGQMTVLKCKSPELRKHVEWLIDEIGLPEGRRRFNAIQRQIRQLELLEAWGKMIEAPANRQHIVALIELDEILQLSHPWPTYLNSGPSDLFQLNLLITRNPILEKLIASVVDKREIEIRLRNITTLTTRWNPHMWLSEDQVMTINQQALNLRLIILVGDCLQFGRIHMTNECLLGTVRAEDAYELLSKAWNQQKSNRTPWIASPERAWLTMDSEKEELYTERLRTLKGYLERYQTPKKRLISAVDSKKLFKFSGNPWWSLGHILIWQDQGFDLLTMMNLGIEMRMKKGQKEITAEQIEILNASKEIPEDEKEKIVDWFNKEFNQSSRDQFNTARHDLKIALRSSWSNLVTTYKAVSRYFSSYPEECFEVFLDV